MDVSLSELSQSDKDLLQAVYNYLLDKIYPKSATKNEKRVIRRKATRFEIVDGELYFKKKKKKSKEVLSCLVTMCMSYYQSLGGQIGIYF